MPTELKLEPGWFQRDIKKATDRLCHWNAPLTPYQQNTADQERQLRQEVLAPKSAQQE